MPPCIFFIHLFIYFTYIFTSGQSSWLSELPLWAVFPSAVQPTVNVRGWWGAASCQGTFVLESRTLHSQKLGLPLKILQCVAKLSVWKVLINNLWRLFCALWQQWDLCTVHQLLCMKHSFWPWQYYPQYPAWCIVHRKSGGQSKSSIIWGACLSLLESASYHLYRCQCSEWKI